MKIAIGVLTATFLLAGCAHKNPAASPAPAPAPVPRQQSKAVIQPDLHARGEVVKVDTEARFVVLTFPPGSVPQADAHLSLYHNGTKVGELKVTGPQQENNTVADIVSGDAQLHDEAREE